MSALDILLDHRRAYATGLLGTLKLCAIAWTSGLLGGAALAFLSEWFPRLVARPALVARRVTEAIPILVMLFWLHYPLQAALGIVIDPFVTTSSLLSVLNTLVVFAVLRAAIIGVPADLIEVARVCGVPKGITFWRIKVPLALRSARGELTSSQVNVLQLSIFGGLISVEELFRISQRINAQVYRPVEVYTVLALFFLAICLPLNLLAARLQR